MAKGAWLFVVVDHIQDHFPGERRSGRSILDRLVHNAHRIEMRGDSMRKNRGKQSG
jgi:DNA replication protein DnaC